MRVLDLFSGIGGFSLGLERAGMQTVAFCEIEPYARRVLAKHWPHVPCYDDVRTLTAERLAADGISVDVICGGFPCQDISAAGNAAGISGARSGLWFEYLRLIGEIAPLWVIIENVSALRSRGMEVVLKGLAAVGYDAEWHAISASHLGAPHQRDRIWIVANPSALRREERLRATPEGRRLLRPRELDSANPWASRENNDEIRSEFVRVVDGIPHRVDRLGLLGNAVVPQIPEMIGRAIMRAANESPASLGDTAGHRDATLRVNCPAEVNASAGAFSELPNCNRQPGATAAQKQENPELAARG